MTSRPNFAIKAAQLFRLYITDGVPGSGIWKPVKTDIQTWGGMIETSLDDLYDKAPSTVGSVGGTANAITATCTPTLDALVAGQTFILTPTATNTTDGPAANFDGSGNKTILTRDGKLLPKNKLLSGLDYLLKYDGTGYRVINAPVLEKGHFFGLLLSNDGITPNTKIDVSAGQCRSDDDTTDIVITTSYVKDLGSTWAVGTGNGGLDTGALAVSTSYDVFAIAKADGSAADFIACKTLLGFSFPAGYTVKRLIGQFMTDGSSHIVAGTWQLDGSFAFAVPVQDATSSNPGTAAVLRTLSVPLNSIAIFTAWLNNVTTAAIAVLITDPAQTDSVPSSTLYDLRTTATSQVHSSEFRRKTNSSGQIRTRFSASGASDVIQIQTRGWITDRGIH